MQITRGKIASAQKTVIFGPEGVGKTVFASQFPEPLYIDTEGGTKQRDVARLPAPGSWTMLTQEIKWVIANPTSCKTLVLDTADWAESLCISHVCATYQVDNIEKVLGGYGKGYTTLAEEFGRMLNLLQDLIDKGVNVVLVAHAQIKKFEQPDEMGAYDRWELKLQKKTAALVKEWADMVLFANFKTYVVEDEKTKTKKASGNKRVMYTEHAATWDAKNRHGLKPMLPFDFAEIASIFAEVKAQVPVQVQAPAPAPAPAPIVEASGQSAIPVAKSPKKAAAPTSVPKAPAPPMKKEAAAPVHEALVAPEARLKPLYDLMNMNQVTEDEIRMVVSTKGYYTDKTDITAYDQGFVDGVLIAAWEQVFEVIKKDRSVPFYDGTQTKGN